MAQQASSPYRSRREAERNNDWAYLVSESSVDVNETEIPSNEKVTIRLGGYSGKVKVSIAKLVAKSGFFRTMLSSNFQEASYGAVELHDDHPAAIVTMLRFILNEKVGPRFTPGAFGVKRYKMSRYEWLNATFLAADKYDVAGLRQRLRTALTEVRGHRLFLREHFFPMKEAYGGEYPKSLYPSYLQRMDRDNGGDGLGDPMRKATMEDAGLERYLVDIARARNPELRNFWHEL